MEDLKMKKCSILITTLAGVCFSISFALAETPDLQKPFTGTELNKFMADWPGFSKWAESIGKKFDHAATPMAGMQYGKDIQDYLTGKGWQTERFFYILSHVAYGLSALQTQQAMPEVVAQLEAQKKQIMESPDIPESQKQTLLSQLDESIKQTGGIPQQYEDIPASELDLIRNNMEKLMAVMEAN